MEKINGKKIFEVSCWWGGDNPGSESYSVTDKRNLYYCQKSINGGVTEEKIEFLKELTENEYQEIVEFIKLNIVGKDFGFNMIFDAGFDVFAEYNNVKYSIKNNKENLYEPAIQLIKKISDNR